MIKLRRNSVKYKTNALMVNIKIEFLLKVLRRWSLGLSQI